MGNLEEKANDFAGEDVTVNTRVIPLPRDGERPTIVQYLADLSNYRLRENNLLRPDGTLAAQYEGNSWKLYISIEEMRDYTHATCRSQRG